MLGGQLPFGPSLLRISPWVRGSAWPLCDWGFFLCCLLSGRQEMDSLQRQMEEHTFTVPESLPSWTQAEGHLSDPATAGPALLGDHANPRGDTQKHGQSRASKEGPGQ